MRTIKFRAWDTIDKRMRYENDVEGIKEYPSLLAVGFHGLPICISPDSFKADEIIGWNRDHNLILMQYTGIKDKNDKEIYEGDIVQYKSILNENIGTIKFGEYEQDGSGGEYSPTVCLGIYIQRLRIIPTDWDIVCGGPVECEEDDQVSPCKTEMEVIGNIYENPELVS